jgi:PTH1 family peptidyl-tRNA hydrolase
MDLPRGIIKISFGRGAGGHHGVESIIRAVKTKNFTRIRIGVSEPAKKGTVKNPQGDKKIIDFLVKEMQKGDFARYSKIFAVVGEALTTIIIEGRAKAMNAHN